MIICHVFFVALTDIFLQGKNPKKQICFQRIVKTPQPIEQTLFKQEEAVHFGLFSAAKYLHSAQVNIYACFL